MFNFNKINDKFQATGFYECSHGFNEKCHTLAKFLKAKNKFNHRLILKEDTFIINNKEIFLEQLLSLLNNYDKYKLYKIFLTEQNHFITSRNKFLNIYLNDFIFTKYLILSSFSNIFVLPDKDWDVKFNNYDFNWSDEVLFNIKQSLEYNPNLPLDQLHYIYETIKLNKHIFNFKYLFDVNNFTKNFWKVYIYLIFHPHSDNLFTLNGHYLYHTQWNQYDNIFRYINEILPEINIKNIFQLFNSDFISFILNNTINGKYIEYQINDIHFQQFINYCRKELNK